MCQNERCRHSYTCDCKDCEHPETRDEAIARLEASGDLDPSCAFCQREIYSQTKAMPQDVFCPRHKASSLCESGKRAHCTCDTCF
jgi:hypothetical protein